MSSPPPKQNRSSHHAKRSPGKSHHNQRSTKALGPAVPHSPSRTHRSPETSGRASVKTPASPRSPRPLRIEGHEKSTKTSLEKQTRDDVPGKKDDSLGAFRIPQGSGFPGSSSPSDDSQALDKSRPELSRPEAPNAIHSEGNTAEPSRSAKGFLAEAPDSPTTACATRGTADDAAKPSSLISATATSGRTQTPEIVGPPRPGDADLPKVRFPSSGPAQPPALGQIHVASFPHGHPVDDDHTFSAFDHPGIPDERSKGNDLAEAKTDKGPLDTVTTVGGRHVNTTSRQTLSRRLRARLERTTTYTVTPEILSRLHIRDETNETRYLGTEKAVLLRWVGVFVIACGIALAIAALSFLIRFLGSGTLEHAKGLCLTDSCQYQANLIESHVDRNVDPCEDFHAFACSKWTAPAEAYSYDTALMRVQIIKWFNGFHKLLENGAKRYVWATRAERMHKECMSDVDKSAIDKGIGLLKSFMRDRRIPWPGPPIPEVEPLSVLLDLAYNWNLGLWFDARPLRTAVTKGEPLLSLLIDHGAFIGAWSALHYQVVHGGTEAYSRYWNSIQSIFSEGTPLPDVGKSEIQDIATRESMILKALYDAAGSTVMKPARFQIKDVERYTPNISAAVWNRAIEENTVLTGSAAWHRPFDTITAADSAFLGVVNHLSTVFTREEILSHLSWFFAQVFVSLVNRNYLVAKFGDEAIANAQKPFFCATEVEASNELLIVALYTLLHFSAEVRDMIDLRMASVKNAVLEKIDGSMSWADKSSKEVVVAKVQKAETILWPPIEVLEDTALSATYGNVVRTKKSFIERWIDSYNITRTLRWDPRYHEAMKLARNFVLPYFRYDYVLNAVRVSIAALDRPFHVADGTAAMFYGGLGFVYARELVKAFDETGRLVDAEGNIGASWASQSWEEASLAKRDCLQGRSPFPEMPALEAVHSAFKRAVADEHGPQERVMLNYTEEQVFFITACFTLCAVSNSAVRLFSGDCNKAARNYAPFAAAFTCPVGSKMNPERQCPYFD